MSLVKEVDCSAGAWTATFDLTSFRIGAVSISVNQFDIQANRGVASREVVRSDSTVQVAIGAASSISNLNKGAYAVSGRCTDNGQSVAVAVGNLSSKATCTTLAWSISLDVEALPDGEVMVTADHSGGGADSPQAVAYVMKDTLLPTVSIDEPAKLSDAVTYVLAGNCSESGREVSVTLGGTALTGQPACEDGRWKVDVYDSLGALSAGDIAVLADHE